MTKVVTLRESKTRRSLPKQARNEFMTCEAGMYWSGNARLFAAAVRAEKTGESLDEIYDLSAARMALAKSRGSLSQRPRIKKSSVTPCLATSKAAKVSVIGLRPFSNRDQ